ARARARAETTGIAPQTAAAIIVPSRSERAKCQEQTWPDLPRNCLARPSTSSREVRVIAIDGTVPDRPATPPPTWGMPNVAAHAPARAAASLNEARQAATATPTAKTASANTENDDHTLRVLDVPSADNPAQRRRVIIRRVDRMTIF